MLPTSKEIMKLAKACRKAGIKRFKSAEFEFELSDETPSVSRRASRVAQAPVDNAPFETDSLSDEALLFWSAGGPVTGTDAKEEDNS